MARWGISAVTNKAQTWVSKSVGNLRHFNRQSAVMLAVLISAPVFAIGLARADDSSTPENSTHGPSVIIDEESVINDKTAVEPGSTSTQTTVQTNSSAQSNDSPNVNVRVQGNVTTTNENGNTKTETFEESYTSDDGNTTNNFSVNVSSSTDSKTKIRVKSNSDIDVDMKESSSFEIDD